jgi:aspartate 1-decarboxylase
MRIFLRSKLHKAIVTDANLDYEGSITIDETLMKKANLAEYEKVMVVDNTNGQRVETYVIKGKKNSGEIVINGAAAHRIKTGDEVIIMAFESFTKKPKKPKIVVLKAGNKIARVM